MKSLKKLPLSSKSDVTNGSNTTRVYLTSSLPRKQVLVIDTATQPPEAVTKQVMEWLNIK